MTEFIIDLIAWGGYFGIFLLMALENIVPPVPSEVIMGLGGIAVSRGHMTVVPLIAAGTAGSVVGNYFWYYIGRHVGYERFRPFVERHGRWLTIEWSDIEKVHHFFVKRGGWVIFVFRFMPTFRTVISLPAGMTFMPVWKFVVWTAAGSAIWNTVLAYAGILLGSRFQQLDRYVGPVSIATFVIIALLYGWRVLTWKPKG